MHRKHFLQGLSLCLAAPQLFAQSVAPYPNKPIRVVVPFPPGGGVDVITRMLGDRLAAQWGQPIVIDNKPGAGTLIGASNVTTSPADGYTVLAATADTLAVAAALQSKPVVLPHESLLGLTQIVRTPLFIAVKPDSAYKTLADFVSEARKRPGALTYGSAGVGTIHHMAMEVFAAQARIDVKHVPYRGSLAALSELMGGLLDVVVVDSPSALPQMKGGKIRVLAISTEARSVMAPDVPTIAEQGFPGYSTMTWMGFAVAKGTPAPIVERLFNGIRDAIESPEIGVKLRAMGLEPATSKSPADFAAFAEAERVRWTAIIKSKGIAAE